MRSTYETLDSVEYTGERTRRLRPPARLQGRAKAIFIETVSGCAVGHFRASDLPLLERYCELELEGIRDDEAKSRRS